MNTCVELVSKYFNIFYLHFYCFPDIMEIPESISYCKALQVADFSGNPLTRLLMMVLFYVSVGVLLLDCRTRCVSGLLYLTFFGHLGCCVLRSTDLVKMK